MARRVENQFLLHQSNRTCITGTYILDISKKKKGKETVTKGKSLPPPPPPPPPPLLLKKNKQINRKSKKKQKKSLVSISNVGDQLLLGLVLNLSQTSAGLQQRSDLPR